MTQISSFVFLKNQLGKCFKAMKYNAYYLRQKKQQPKLYSLKVAKSVFQVLFYKFSCTRKANQCVSNKHTAVKAKLFKVLKLKYESNTKMRSSFKNLLLSKSSSLLRKSFTGL